MNELKNKFEDLMSHDLCDRILEQENWEFLSSLSPHIAIMKDYPQNHPYHCYDLLVHTCKTVDGIDPSNLTDEEFRLLKTAGFFHDIGKPSVAKDKVNQYGETRTIFHNHAEKSEEISIPILEQLGYDENEIRKLRFYIVAHDLFLQYTPENAYSHNSRRTIINVENIKKAQIRFMKERPDLEVSRHDFFVMMSLSRSDAFSHAKLVLNHDGTVFDTNVDMALRALMIQKVCIILENEEKG